MKNYLFFTAAVALAAALAFSLLGRGEQAQAAGAPQVISVFGKVPGTNLAVHITAVVPEGRSSQAVAAEVLAARDPSIPPTSASPG